MDLSSALKVSTVTPKFHLTNRIVIQGRLSKHQIMASLNASNKSVTHYLELPCMNIKGTYRNEYYAFGLKLYLSFKNAEPKNYIALGITNKNEMSIKLNVEISIERHNSLLEQFGKYSGFFDKNEERKSYFLKERIMRDPSTYLPDGNMIIVCEITMDAPEVEMPIHNLSKDICSCKHLAKRFDPETCFDSVNGYWDELSDFTLQVDSSSFKCHKAILSSKSEVFQNMFSSNMKEARTDEMKIDDMSSETVSSLLIFMYTDIIHPKKITIELLGAADKYMITRLVNICEDNLSRNVSMNNVCEYWYEAYLHGTYGLQQACEEFIARNLDDLKDTPEFQELGIKSPEIVKNISSLLSNSFKI